MRMAILGANGQLGSDLVEVFSRKVDILPLTRSEFDAELDPVERLLKFGSMDVIINTIAYHKVEECEENVEKAYRVNTIFPLELARYCSKNNLTLVHFSTDYVFDGEKKEPYTEDDIPRPLNVYGLTKRAGEEAIITYGTKYYIVRSSSLYGVVGASGKGGNFPYTIIKKAKAGEPLKVVDDIFMVPTHTYDLAQAIWRLVTDGFPFGIYHITHTGYCSWYEFAKAVLETAGIQVDITPIKSGEFPTKARRPKWSVLGTKKGLQLSHWREGLMEFIRITKEEGRI